MEDLKYWVAFNRVPGLGTARFRLLERHFPTLGEAWRAQPSELVAAGLEPKLASLVEARRREVDHDAEMTRLERAGVRAINWHDPSYPPRLKEIYDPPPVLYVKGTLRPEDERSVAVVGTRKATAYGREVASALVADLCKSGVTIVSGLARGIDSVAHRAALEAGGRTVAVLGNSLDMVYPPENAGLAREITTQGALVSEYPLGTRPDSRNFPRRNRIMSGMTLGTLVVEAGLESGALWTVRHALEQDREVFCVPGSIFSPASRGTNALIQQGAKLVMSYTDILEELNLTVVSHQMEMRAVTQPEDDTERKLLDHITHEPVHIDDIGRRSGLPITVVTSTLAMLELRGLVKQVGGMYYVRTGEVLV